MDCNEKCEDHQGLEISMASLDGKFNIILLLLLSIVGLSGWTTIVATDSSKDIAVLNETFALTAKSHEEKNETMIKRIASLEEKDEDKDERIEDVEEICSLERNKNK